MNPHQIGFRGVTMGDGTNIILNNVTGFEDLPEVDGENHGLSANDGTVPGSWDVQDRVIEADWVANSSDPEEIREVITNIKTVMRPAPTETELRVHLPVIGELVAFVQATGRTVNIADGLAGFGIVGGSLQWVASDPCLYSAMLHKTIVPAFEGSGGLTYPVTYPKDYGTSGSGGSTRVPNSGTTGVWPRITITGPDSGTVQPIVLENLTTGEEIRFTSGGGLTIPAGSTLVVDTHPARRVVRFTDGANRWNTVAGTRWFPIAPGGVDMRFRAQGNLSGVTVTVETRDAYL